MDRPKKPFDVFLFLSQMQGGMFDGHLNEELAKLSKYELIKVMQLMEKHRKAMEK